MKKLYIVLLLVSICGMANAQGMLKGKITDGKEPIPFASIVVVQGGKQFGAAQSDLDGIYTINPICRGKYDVQVSCIGYQTQKMINVPINADKITFIDFKLLASSSKKDTIIPYQMPFIYHD